MRLKKKILVLLMPAFQPQIWSSSDQIFGRNGLSKAKAFPFWLHLDTLYPVICSVATLLVYFLIET